MPDESYIDHEIAGRCSSRVESPRLTGRAAQRLIVELGERQHGVVARRQLLRRGIPRGTIDARVASGRLHKVHHGVYAVGHRLLTQEARWLAAVLAYGGEAGLCPPAGAFLSHRAAGRLWGVLRQDVPVEVTRATRARRVVGVLPHHSKLAQDEVDQRAGVPVTSVCRTLLDLASVLSKRQLERATNEAEVRGLTDPVGLPELLRRHRRRRGTGVVRAVLAERRDGAGVTRSRLEEHFGELVERAALPPPEVNAPIAVEGSFLTVDCLWRKHRVVAELDGRAFHDTPLAFEEDRRRDRLLHAAGWRVIRITWRQLREEPGRIAADLRATLAATGAPSAP